MNKKRILALLLVLALAVTTVMLAGCNPDDDPDNDTEVPEEDLSPAFDGEAKRFSGSFVVLTEEDRAGDQAFNIVDLVSDDNLGDSSIVAAVEARNELIRTNFGIRITREASKDANGDAIQAVNSGDDSYDAFMLSVTQGLTLATGGAILDLSQAEYIDLSQEWWDQGITENLLLAGGAYIAVGDLLTVDKDATWCTLFNKQVLEDKNQGLSDEVLYQVVKDGDGQSGGWTMEYLMTQAATNSTEENDSSKEVWRPNYEGPGVYGLFTQKEVATVILQSGGFTPTIANENSLAGVTVNMDTAFDDAVVKVYDYYGRMLSNYWFLDLDDAVSAYGSDQDGWRDVARGGFMADKAAFFICHVGTINLIRDMESDFGVLPIPKLNETQTEYGNTIQYGNAHCYLIPNRSEANNEKSAYILEAMAFYSSQQYGGEESLNYAYYYTVLRGKATRDDASWEMLDLIFDTRVYDYACALNVSSINNVIMNSVCGTNQSWASNKAAQLGGMSEAIAEQLEMLVGKV